MSPCENDKQSMLLYFFVIQFCMVFSLTIIYYTSIKYHNQNVDEKKVDNDIILLHNIEKEYPFIFSQAKNKMGRKNCVIDMKECV